MRQRDGSFQPHVSRRALLAVLLLCLASLSACASTADDDQRDMSVDGDPALGEAAIERYGCPACHTIPGVANADGLVGPPLSFWAERMYIAGLLINDVDNLTHFIQNPQEVLPGGAMPDMGVTDQDARDIAAYLYTLRRSSLLNFGSGGTARDPLGRPAPGGGAENATPADTEPAGSPTAEATESTPSPTAQDTAEARTIEVIARNYEFEPSTITVEMGRPIRFVVTSEDIYHTFTVKRGEDEEEDLLNIEIDGGETVSGTYTFDEAGSYYLYCIPHEAQGMIGTIEVTEGATE